MTDRIAITGIGINTALGSGWEDHCNAWAQQSSGIGRLEVVDVRDASIQHGGEIKDIYKLAVSNRKLRKLVSRKDFLAVATAEQAMADAGLTDDNRYDPYRRSVYVGSCSTPLSDFHPYFPDVLQCVDMEKRFFDSARFGAEAIHNVNPITAVKVLMNGALAHISQIFEFKGANSNFMDFEVSGHFALENGWETLQDNAADVCLVGAVSTPLDPFQLSDPNMQYDLMNTKDMSEDEVRQAYQPGDAQTRGRLVSEGSLFFVLEKEEAARARSARTYAYVDGVASSALDQSLPLSREKYRSVQQVDQSIPPHPQKNLASFNGSPRYDQILRDSLPKGFPFETCAGQLGDLLEVSALYQIAFGIASDLSEDHSFTSTVMSRFGVSGRTCVSKGDV